MTWVKSASFSHTYLLWASRETINETTKGIYQKIGGAFALIDPDQRPWTPLSLVFSEQV
jgi:hypothetical protein